jgi:hypothetical protein
LCCQTMDIIYFCSLRVRGFRITRAHSKSLWASGRPMFHVAPQTVSCVQDARVASASRIGWCDNVPVASGVLHVQGAWGTQQRSLLRYYF